MKKSQMKGNIKRDEAKRYKKEKKYPPHIIPVKYKFP